MKSSLFFLSIAALGIIALTSGTPTKFVPVGTIQVSDNFYLDKTEVTNHNWVEYLYWINKNHGENSAEYKAALPDTTVWNQLSGENQKDENPLSVHYLRHPAYKDYPVVGVTYDQAIAYCKWRTDRVKDYLLIKYPGQPLPSFAYSLPSVAIWQQAAQLPYDEKVNKQLEGKFKGQMQANLKQEKEHLAQQATGSQASADVTAPIESYWPNAAGFYNLIGNVAELTENRGEIVGGSFITKQADANALLIEKEDGPKAFIGFRCMAVSR